MQFNKDVNYSYWELKTYFKPYDLVIVGSGIVGLSTAISFKQRNRNASVLVVERGVLPNGASTKNAGFACFGSIGELLSDLNSMPEESVWETVEMRWKGLQLLRKRLGDPNIRFEQLGGFELFTRKTDYDTCAGEMKRLNNVMKDVIGLPDCYSKAGEKTKLFGKTFGVIKNRYEGQLDTGFMMKNLLTLAQKKGIDLLNNIHVENITDLGHRVELVTKQGNFTASKAVVATNGFAARLLNIQDVLPARAQVLITKPIPQLKIKGTFHYEQGYYYFRNIDNRILLGGGRNLDVKGETTFEQGLTPLIQEELDRLLREMVLPGVSFEVEHRWSGIMGVGSEKKPIVKNVSQNVMAAVRMGGMGVAIGSWVGEKAAKEIL